MHPSSKHIIHPFSTDYVFRSLYSYSKHTKPPYSHADNPIITTATNVYSEYRGVFTEFRYGRLKNISRLQTSIKCFTTSSEFMQIKQIINVLGYNILFSREFYLFILICVLIRKPIFLWLDKQSKRYSTAVFRNFTCTRTPSESPNILENICRYTSRFL